MADLDASMLGDEVDMTTLSSSSDVFGTNLQVRKNLDTQEFNKVSEKIAVYEQWSAARPTTAPSAPPPPPIQPFTSLSVFLRLRPSTDTTLEILNATTVRAHAPPTSQAFKTSRDGQAIVKDYSFTGILDTDVDQACVYRQAAAPLLERLVPRTGHPSSNSAMLFCYGITNAGKTHTILGRSLKDASTWGILPRALDDLWHRKGSANLTLSYLEVYNEQVYDLLPTTPRASYESREVLRLGDIGGDVMVRGLATHTIQSMEHGLELLSSAMKLRQTATNNLNSNSSRSHCICQLTLQSSTPVTLWVIDLAGSERSKRTSAGTVRQKEAALINKSLMTLMRCLMTLRDGTDNKSVQPPFRESKLTHLLMSHLGQPSAAGATAMIVNVCPTAEDFDETQHVLAYATQAKQIRNVPLEDCPDYVKRQRARQERALKQSTVGKLLAKLSPKGMRSKKRQADVKAAPSNKRTKMVDLKAPPAATTVDWKSTREYKSLQAALSIAETENAMLKDKIVELEDEIDNVEARVRAEVAEEWKANLKASAAQHQAVIEQFRKSSKAPQTTGHKKPASAKLEELREQLQESEEENLRLHQQHQAELAALKLEYESQLSAKDESQAALCDAVLCQAPPDEDLQAMVEELRRKLAQSEASKKELMANYETLLYDGAEDDDDDEEDDDDDESSLDDEEPIGLLRHSKVVEESVVPKISTSPVEESHEPEVEDDEANSTATAEVDAEPVAEDEEDPAEEDDDSQPSSRRLTRQQVQNATGGDEPKGTSRPPFGKILSNSRTESMDSLSGDECFGPSKWLRPSKVKKDPDTGKYLRPRGRKPKGTESWDENEGAWRLSMAN